MKGKIIIGSRESTLAVIQSELVRDWITETHPELEAELLTMKTTGDKILDRRLDEVGGKGLFVKELDRALLEGRSELSVHSLKDLPMEISPELPLLAFSRREDPRDCLVLPEGVKDLDLSKPVGCSSRRRMLQLQELFPGVTFKNIRGNVQTRLRKVDSGEYSATILAAAGLKRLHLEHRISRYFTVEEMIPAAGQGILAIQGRANTDYGYLQGFEDPESALCARCERAFIQALDGGCTSPVAGYAWVKGQQIFLSGLYYDEEQERSVRATLAGALDKPEDLGRELARRLIRRAAESNVKPGKVYITGAGPGDLGLMTIKARDVLEQADTIVYDSLIGDAYLAILPAGAKLINVGKRAGHHIRSQYEINRILLEEAWAGHTVVRLKGGDPFLFGRGGEELELLSANHIPYEVIPGVTSSLAVPAYNGMPVTHRDFCSSLHIFTGHKRAGETLRLDFDAMVKLEGTLVFLMGVSALEDICQGLKKAGMDPAMPAALLSRGTTAAQQRILADISTLPQRFREHPIDTPAIILVGRVCALTEEFAWYEKLPLFGEKLVVTRPRQLSSEMAGKLRRLGAEVLELPTISTERIPDNRELSLALEHLAEYDWLVFTSPTGVRFFFEEFTDRGKDIRSLGSIKIAAIGKGSARELKKRGIYADLMPEIFDGAHLGRVLAEHCQPGARILLPRAAKGNPEILEEIRKGDHLTVEDIPLYETVYRESPCLDLKKLFEDSHPAKAVFTSASTVKGFAAAAGDLDFTKVTAICIGPQTAACAAAYHMQIHTSPEASMDSMVETIISMKKEG